MPSPCTLPRARPASTSSSEPAPHLFPFPEGPPVSLVSQARPSSGVSHTSSFPGLFPAPSPGHDLSIPSHLLSPLNPFSPPLLQPHPYIWLFSPPVFISHFQFFSPSHWSSDLRASLLAKHPLWLLWGLRFQAGVTRATPALPGPPPSTLDAHLQEMWSPRPR